MSNLGVLLVYLRSVHLTVSFLWTLKSSSEHLIRQQVTEARGGPLVGDLPNIVHRYALQQLNKCSSYKSVIPILIELDRNLLDIDRID